MRIISKFHDYYDGLATFEKTDRIYDRKSESYSIDLKRKYGKGSGLYDLRWTFHVGESDWLVNNRVCWRVRNAVYGVLGVCGKLYPTMSVIVSETHDSPILNNYFYHLEDLAIFLESQKVRVNMRSYWGEQIQPKEVLPMLVNNQCIKNMFTEFQTPIFYLEFIPNCRGIGKFDGIKNQHVLTTNVRLVDFQFQKFKDAWQVYQDIDTYLGNELALNKNVPDSTGNDVDLAKAKGFDKWSFRKESTK